MHADAALSLLIIALGAFAIPPLCGRIGIPAAVGEILFGVLVGPHALGWMTPDEFTTFLAEFGFAFLMFLAGLELEFHRIEREGLRGLVLGGLSALLFFPVAAALTTWLGLPPYVLLAFGAVSVGILLATLNETGHTRTGFGQTLIIVGSLAEFFTIVLLTGFSLYYRVGLTTQLALEMGKLGLILVIAYLLLVVLRTLIWWFPGSFARIVATSDPSEIGVRSGMAIMLVFVALALMMGVESILGSFIAGALFSFVFREKGILHTKMSSIGFGFFVPIFFIWVGSEFELSAVLRLEMLPLLGLFFAASLVTKMAVSLTLLLHGFSLRQAVAAGILYGAPLTMLVVIARIGREVQVLPEATAGALVLLAIVTSILCPWLFRVVAGRPGGSGTQSLERPRPPARAAAR